MSTTSAQPVVFSKDAADRIGKAVVAIEQLKPGDRLPTITWPGQQTFWAIILTQAMDSVPAPTMNNVRYYFMRVAPDPANTGGKAAFRVGGINGLAYQIMGDVGIAIEANGNPSVPLYTITRVDYIGTDADNQPCFLFTHSGTATQDYGVPLHDHRDNMNGSFAFSVWHPGTSLPQSPFAI